MNDFRRCGGAGTAVSAALHLMREPANLQMNAFVWLE